MKSSERSVVAMVLVFTASAVMLLWSVTLRWQEELRVQVSDRAEQRGSQLVEALAETVIGDLALIDHILLSMRSRSGADLAEIRALALADLNVMPRGLVSHVTLVDADGKVFYTGMGAGVGDDVDLSKRSHFHVMQTQGDQLVIGEPVASWLKENQWFLPVGRPLYRDGRFNGALYLMVSTEYMSESFGRLALAEDDIVALLHPSGRYLVGSHSHRVALGQSVPSDRPYLLPGSGESGVFRRTGQFDGVARLYSWKRLPGTGLILVLGLAESSVLAPLVSPIKRSQWQTGALSGVLLLSGLMVAWLLARVERGTQSVHASAQQLKDAQRMAKVGHYSMDLRTTHLTWSDEIYRIFEVQRGEPGSSTYGFLTQRLHPEDRALFDAAYERSIKERVKMDVKHRILLPDGRIKHIHALGIFEYEGGVPVRSHGTAQDITEVSTAQADLERLNNELEGRVENRTRALGALNNELEAFTYSVSHDLRAPLRRIHGLVSQIEEESNNLSPDGRSHLLSIRDSSQRMEQLITDFLTMAQHSQAVVHKERVNLSELALIVVSDLERTHPNHKVGWQIDPDLEAMADPMLMLVVLQNLLGNAWKYTLQASQPQVSLQRVGVTDGMAEFAVRDNGAGFDMAYVGQPFNQLQTQHGLQSSGAGLASVQQLIQRHGGKVWAEGVVGQGAVFYFSLPQVPDVQMLARYHQQSNLATLHEPHAA